MPLTLGTFLLCYLSLCYATSMVFARLYLFRSSHEFVSADASQDGGGYCKEQSSCKGFAE